MKADSTVKEMGVHVVLSEKECKQMYTCSYKLLTTTQHSFMFKLGLRSTENERTTHLLHTIKRGSWKIYICIY